VNPIYLDLHIHTSEDPDQIVENYDVDLLLAKVKLACKNSNFLISFTDHNTINKAAYLEAKKKVENLLLGAELHIRNFSEEAPYHCHIFFDVPEIDDKTIDTINSILDTLYPQKTVGKADKIPHLEDVVKKFDAYDFLLLPHGGQSHSTFDTSIPRDHILDNRIEKGIYFNQFDGFTARSNKRLERTIGYFTRLGINEFVNLVTCTDNYDPKHYPNAKDPKADPFLPTWMMALPTFDGLRLSLSESSRLIYGHERPQSWSESIRKVALKNDLIDIDVELTPGLNVVIGGSSSGKTLFVDSIFRKINESFEGSDYQDFSIEDISVINPSGVKPHYLAQNYIIGILNKKGSSNGIDNIEIIRKVFPGDSSVKAEIEAGLARFKKALSDLIDTVVSIEAALEALGRIPVFSRLLTNDDLKENFFEKLLPDENQIEKIDFQEHKKNSIIGYLDELDSFLSEHPFVDHDQSLIFELKREIDVAFNSSQFEGRVRRIIDGERRQLNVDLSSLNHEQQGKRENFEKLIEAVGKYTRSLNKFYEILNTISEYSITSGSQEVESMGHKLFIENEFSLNKEKFIEVINGYLKSHSRVSKFEELQPDTFFTVNFREKSPKVHGYEDFKNKVYGEFESLNVKSYRIITSENKNFDDLSAGWKTSVILDLILGYEGDIAPLIIDQPEDNLATGYINRGLIDAIKKIKAKKQVILVSHNATIPMLGDAQNIILCKNENGKITIRSARLEGKIDNKSVVDHVAEITDGGKRSIKKRVKKYNLKNFRE